MYTPSSAGGHALYSQEVLEAAARQSCISGVHYDFSLVTSANLAERFSSSIYQIYRLLPIQKPKNAYSTVWIWRLSRVVYYFRREWTLLSWLRDHPLVGLVHFQELSLWLGPAVIFLLRKILKRKVVYTVHNVRLHRYPHYIPQTLVDSVRKLTFLQCDALVVHSDSLRENLYAILGSRSRLVEVAPHGVWSKRNDLPSFEPRIRRDSILFFGNIRRNKGLHVLIQAVRQKKFVEKLVIAGYPEEQNYFNNEIRPLMALARSEGISIDLFDHFILDCDLPLMFAKACIVVLPYEDFSAQSGVLFNALGFGVPVVSSMAGAVGEVVRRFNIGETVSQLTAENLSEAMSVALARSRSGCYESGLGLAIKELSWDMHAKSLLEVYSRVYSNGEF